MCIIIIIIILPLLSYQYRINSTDNLSQFITHSSHNLDSNTSQKFTVGIEAHVQLSLPNKLFCKCRTNFTNNVLLNNIKDKLIDIKQQPIEDNDYIDFHNYFINNHEEFTLQNGVSNTIESLPNVNVCHVCLGEPGSYGRLNPYVIPFSVLAARLLCCKEINNEVRFHRKIYEYVDLPKQYQLSQCKNPMAINGYINVSDYGIVSVKQIHIEEDTAKRFVDGLDYNRSGISLLEVVTDPIEATCDQIVNVCKEIQRLFRDSKLSMCEMHRGNLRFDINISSDNLPNIIEVKNLNSFERIRMAVSKVLEYGSQKIQKFEENSNILDDDLLQYAKTHSPINIVHRDVVTALWNGKDNFDVTRPKMDYMYVEDWNIYPIKLNDIIIDSITQLLPQYNTNIISNKLVIPYNKYPTVTPNLLSHIYKDPILTKYFEECGNKCNPNILSTLLVHDYIKVCKSNGVKVNETKLTSDKFIELVNLVDSKKIDILQARGAIETLAMVWDGNVIDIFNIRRFTLLDMHDTKLLVDEYINNSPTRLLNLVTNGDSYIKTIIHEINRMNEGIANPILVIEYCKELVSKYTKGRTNG